MIFSGRNLTISSCWEVSTSQNFCPTRHADAGTDGSQFDLLTGWAVLQYRIVFLEMLPKAPKKANIVPEKDLRFFFCWIEMAFSGTILVFWACGGACMYGFLLRVWSFQSTGFWQEKCMQDSNFHHTKTHPTFLTPMDPPFQHPKTKPCRLRYGFELAIKSSESDDPRRFNTPPVH